MNTIPLETYKEIRPMIYAYNTPGVIYHDGWTKIGYTEAQTVENRIGQQTGTADIQWILAWKHNALYLFCSLLVGLAVLAITLKRNYSENR